jgi:hypothetical protein
MTTYEIPYETMTLQQLRVFNSGVCDGDKQCVIIDNSSDDIW